jgi:SAM-dependent methyltransferase
MKRLNLGCGESKKEGFINVDWHSELNPEVKHDLNVFPYPFAEAEFDDIEAFHILEHLDRPFQVMKELHRILKPGGTLSLRVPHFSRGFTHAEHAHGFDLSFAQYFNRHFTRSGFFGVEFRLDRLTLRWLAFFHLLPYFGYGPASIAALRAVNAVVTGLANLSPHLCSRIWCYWVGGFDEIEFRFTAVK